MKLLLSYSNASFLLLLLINLLVQVKCGIYDLTTIMNIKDSEGIPLNERYALPGETTCTFTYWVYVNSTQQLTGFDNSLNIQFMHYDQINFKYVAKVTYQRSKGDSGTITIKALPSQFELTKSYSCIETPKTDLIVYQNKNSSYPYPSYQSTYYVLSKFLNYSKYSSGSISSGNAQMPGLKVIVPTRTFFNTILFQILPNFPQVFNTSIDNNALTIFDGLFTVPFQHIYKSFLPIEIFQHTSIVDYPTGCSNQGSTNYWFCYVYITLDSSYSKYYFNTFDSSATASKYLFKIKSNSTSLTYLNILPSVSTLNSYYFAFFNGIKLQQYLSTFSVFYSYSDFYETSSSISLININPLQYIFNTSTHGYYGPIVFTSEYLFGIQRYYQYPFGVVGTGKDRIDYSLVFLNPKNAFNFWWAVNFQYSADPIQTIQNLTLSGTQISSLELPKVTLLDYKDNGDTFAIIIGASHSYGISSISVNLCTRSCINVINPSHLIQGTIYNGIYQYTLQKTRVGLQYSKADIQLKSRDGNSNSYQLYDIYNDNLDYIKPLPFLDNKLTPDTVKRIYFAKNDINVGLGSAIDNTMYIETTERFSNFVFGFSPSYMLSFKPPGVTGQYFFRDESDPQYTSIWNSNLNRYEINFKIPPNVYGPVSYIITPLQLDNTFFYQYLANGSESELRVFSSNSNILPPIIDTIVPVLKNLNTISFTFTLLESSNSLSYGIININSDYDPMGRNMTFNGPSRGSATNDLVFEFQIYDYDRPQTYKVSYVWLNDTSGHISEYPSKTKVNPMMKFRDSNLYSITTIDTSYILDTTPPIIDSLQVSTLSLNEINRTVSFILLASDPVIVSQYTSNLSIRHLPVVYLSSSNYTVISSVANIDSTLQNGSVVYKTSITISNGFGYPEGILISIFGLTDNNLNVRGYTPQDLTNNNWPSFINSSITEGPFLTTVQFNNSTLTINGFRLGLTNSKLVVYYQFDSLIDNIVDFVSFSDRQIITDKVKESVYENYITVKVITNDGLESNSINIQIGNSIPTTSPIKQCPGNPECGGPLKGKCLETTYVCSCIEPYSGVDCNDISSGTEGEVNQENPNVNFTYVDEKSEYKSYIVIHSLVELDLAGNPVEQFIFKNWSLVIINSNSYQFNTTFKSNDGSGGVDSIIDTHLIVNVTKFDKKTDIVFANQTLTMDASTVKYSIGLDRYLFKNQLNTLKLLISASLESAQTKDTCSSNQLTDTSDSSFVKIAVNNVYLYGKFYKRSIIDGLVTQVSQNIETNISTSSTSSKSETYIAINIQNYRREVKLDPDFSVLVSSQSNNNDPNSICSSNALTKSQLIGIIIGSAMGLVVILIFGSLILFRKSTSFRLLYYKLTKKYKSKKVEMNQVNK